MAKAFIPGADKASGFFIFGEFGTVLFSNFIFLEFVFPRGHV
jgi:hypothetical protein